MLRQSGTSDGTDKDQTHGRERRCVPRVGYGSYTYRYESGHSGDAFLTGFAVRGRELVVYLLAENPAQVALLAKLGRHRMAKSCLYFRRLADLDVKALEALIAGSVADVKRRYPRPGDV